ncbi:MAG TPA: DNA primase [Bryobacteraceae bacterium]|nr:DNA primase [Bryobacteraceae bacterium]
MDFVEQVKASVDIVQVIGERVRLRKSGAQRYTGLCPFHNEKTPSFTVHAGMGFYKCFGCGVSGDVIKYVEQIEGISFYEALKLLAERHGIPMPKRAGYTDPDTRLRAALYQMHEIAEEAFRNHLNGPAGTEARAYLARRGVAPEVAAQFGLGFAERSGRFLLRLLEQRKFTPEQLEASGLVARRDDGSFYDRFRNRLMFPIHNETGKIIGFGGRALHPDENPKYLNSAETPIYKKSYVLYNLHRARDGIRKTDRSVLVEGYMDVIGVYASGVREVVASCGTSLTSQQVQLLRRHSGRIVVNFDPDPAGANAAERSINMLLEEGMHVRIMELDGGLDPDEYCKERGAAAYIAKLDSAKGYFYWLADRARARFGMRTAEERVAGLQFLLPAVQRITDKLERVTVANEVAAYLGVDSGLVLDYFRKSVTERRESSPAPPKDPTRPAEKILLNLLLGSAEARESLIPRLRPLGAVGQFATRHIFETVFALQEAGDRVAFDTVHARLEENDRELLEAALLAAETGDVECSMEQAEECVRSLRHTDRQAQVGELKARIRDCERAGDMAGALHAAGELRDLERTTL